MNLFDRVFSLDNCNETIGKCDFIISCMPENKESMHYWNKHKFKIMKTSCIFINIGRGSAVVLSDLRLALKNKNISGAVLDVTQPEPLPLLHLCRFTRRLVVTNHSSYYSKFNKDRLIELYKHYLLILFLDQQF